MKRLLAALTLLTTLALSGAAFADDSGAQSFVEGEHTQITALLHQPASPGRDAQVNQRLETMVNYEELAHRAFGQPCPLSEPGCQNRWGERSDAEKTEVSGLLKQLIQKNYRKNLLKTLDYDVTYKGTKDAGGDTRVRTEAKSKLKPRDPPVQVDYIVRAESGGYRVVDIVTEGSSLTKNYYDQFNKMLANPDQGYPHITAKLREKIAKN